MARPVPVNMQPNIIANAADALTVAMPEMLAGAIGQSLRELPSVVKSMGQAMQLRAMPKERMRRANIELAEAAHTAVIRGWRSRLPAHTPPGGSAKHLSGHLGRALADPGMTLYTTDRVISFVNTDVLDDEAQHWYRVNYGASGTRFAEGRNPGRFVVQLNGQAVGSFKDDLPPDSRSWLPAVFVMHDNGALFPKSTKVVPSESGARPARFFDLGYAKIAREAPRTYEALWRKYINERNGAAKARMAKKGVTMVGDFRMQRTSWTARVRRS